MMLRMLVPLCLQDGQCKERLQNLFVSFACCSVTMAIGVEGCSSDLSVLHDSYDRYVVALFGLRKGVELGWLAFLTCSSVNISQS